MFSLQRYKLYTIYRNFFTEKNKISRFLCNNAPEPPKGGGSLLFTVYCLIRTMNREP